jgi:large subunit ribosomal protein L3
MTQFFDANNVVPVTVIQAGPCTILQKKTMERDRYSAIQLGFLEKKESRTTKPELGHFKTSGSTPKKVVREIRLGDDEGGQFEVGQVLKADLFSAGDFVDVVGTSKGKGFQGVMKRHNFKGSQTNSHGTHEYFRHGGSIGCRLTPGRTFPGKRMGGQMGNAQVTVQNLVVFGIDAERNLIFVRGAVPGAANSYVTIYQAKKRKRKA